VVGVTSHQYPTSVRNWDNPAWCGNPIPKLYIMKTLVYDIKTSKSGKTDIVVLQTTTTVKTLVGLQEQKKFYNISVQKDSATVDIDQEIELDLNDFEIRKSEYIKEDGTKTISLWLEGI